MRHNRHNKRALRLDKEHKKFLGVCAGIADYLEVEPWSVRLVFLVSVLFGGWFLVPLYFIAWFCLDDKVTDGVASVADSQPMKHFRNVDYKKKLYRNTEDGKFLGVCAGVADYLEINVFAVRLFFLASVFFAAALPMFLYFGAYFILEEKPESRKRETARGHRRKRHNIKNAVRSGVRSGMAAGMDAVKSATEQVGEAVTEETEEYEEFDDDAVDEHLHETSTYSKRREFKYCARKFSTLQSRLVKMEAYVTSSQFRLHREFKNI